MMTFYFFYTQAGPGIYTYFCKEFGNLRCSKGAQQVGSAMGCKYGRAIVKFHQETTF